jgi:tripartite-type tricarboxylate transporter receptor subunit TctC
MRRFGPLILSLIVTLSPTISRGGSYPDRPIRLVVGFGVGGPTDIPARFIADKLSEALGQRVFVENKPASGGIVATRDVIARPADGYTLLLCSILSRSTSPLTKIPLLSLAIWRPFL